MEENLPRPEMPESNWRPRLRLVAIATVLFGFGSFMGMAGGFASLEEHRTLDLVLTRTLRTGWLPGVLLILIIVAPVAYKCAGLKGLVLAPVAFALAIFIGMAIIAFGSWAFFALINWMSGSEGKLAHGVWGALFGIMLALPIFLFLWWAQLKEIEEQKKMKRTG